MTTHGILLIVAIVLFVIDAIVWWVPGQSPWGSKLTPAGLAFFAASFLT